MATLTHHLEAFKGDAIDIEVEVNQDLTGWNIRAELWDSTGPQSGEIHSVRKATSGVVGGADDQIDITSPTAGEFTVFIDTGDTTDFKGDVQLEIELENDTSSGAGQKWTVFRGAIHMKEERIQWDGTAD